MAERAEELASDIQGLSVLEVPTYSGAVSRDEFKLALRDAVNDTIGSEPVTAVTVALPTETPLTVTRRKVSVPSAFRGRT